jgi:hypothetical protein
MIFHVIKFNLPTYPIGIGMVPFVFFFYLYLFQRKCLITATRHYNNSEYFGIILRIALSDYVINGYNNLAINLQYIVSFNFLLC